MASYLLLIRNAGDTLANLSPEQMEAIANKYFAWTDQLRREGRLLASEELQPGGNVVRSRDGQLVVDGPYTETKEGIGGFYLVTAADEAEAIAIAKDCPAFLHGGLLEVRATVEYN